MTLSPVRPANAILRRMKHASWWLLVGLLQLCLQMTARAQSVHPTFPTLTVAPAAAEALSIGNNMGWLTDPTGKLSLSDVEADTQNWRAIDRPTPNFGFSNAAHWFRFQVDVPGHVTIQRYLELPVPFLDDLQVFHWARGSPADRPDTPSNPSSGTGDAEKADRVPALRLLLERQFRLPSPDLSQPTVSSEPSSATRVNQHLLGDTKPFHQRPLQHQNFVMPVTLQPGTNVFYMRLASTGTIEASLRLWPHEAFVADSNRENLANGAVAGVLLVMMIYNLFVGFSLRDGNYLLYIGFVASYLLFYFTLTGYSYQHLWPEAVHWNSIAISSFIASTIAFTSWFTTVFLRLRAFSPKLHRLMLLFGWAGCALFLASLFLPYALTIRVGTVLAIPVAATALVAGYWRWASGAQFARFFCLAWTALLLGFVILTANKMGWIEANVWTNNASQIGIILQVVLLSFTLADRMNHDRARRIEAQEAALAHERHARESSQALVRAIEESNRELENRVTARTADLNEAMSQLQAANHKLTELSTTDALTQVRNRAFFDEALRNEVSRASRHGSQLSLVMFDIDHFKKINDTYGHPAGDACLRAVANTARQSVRRAGDVLARYGGEEFAIVLADLDETHVLELIDHLRTSLQAQPVVFDGQTIRFTASFGVAHGTPQPDTQGEHILSLADQALYRAKHDGRNCVRQATF